jgi:hypothetical protein
MAMSNAEKQAAWRARRDQYVAMLEKKVRTLEAELDRLRNQNSATGVAPSGADSRSSPKGRPSEREADEAAPTRTHTADAEGNVSSRRSGRGASAAHCAGRRSSRARKSERGSAFR